MRRLKILLLLLIGWTCNAQHFDFYPPSDYHLWEVDTTSKGVIYFSKEAPWEWYIVDSQKLSYDSNATYEMHFYNDNLPQAILAEHAWKVYDALPCDTYEHSTLLDSPVHEWDELISFQGDDIFFSSKTQKDRTARIYYWVEWGIFYIEVSTDESPPAKVPNPRAQSLASN